MEEKLFTSSDFCEPGHNKFLHSNGAVICKICSQSQILKRGVFIKNPRDFSSAIDDTINSWMEEHDFESDKIFSFLREGFAQKMFQEYFPEILSSDEYCHECGDSLYHGKCQCSYGFPMCSV